MNGVRDRFRLLTHYWDLCGEGETILHVGQKEMCGMGGMMMGKEESKLENSRNIQ